MSEVRIYAEFVVKDKFTYIFKDRETGKELFYKVWKTKPFQNDFKTGVTYQLTINGEWINDVDEVKDYETPEPTKPHSDNPRGDLILAQSTLKEAVQIAITQRKEDISLRDVFDVHREIYRYMKNKQYE